ncbi:hypothetical protein evm_000657 [Chilo suppressalis]|nr:hypothetical protein evm_000657 [Chilo suppressalis]
MCFVCRSAGSRHCRRGAALQRAAPGVRKAAHLPAPPPPPPHLPLQPQPCQGSTCNQHDGILRGGRREARERSDRRKYGPYRGRGEAGAVRHRWRGAQAAGPHVRPPGRVHHMPTARPCGEWGGREGAVQHLMPTARPCGDTTCRPPGRVVSGVAERARCSTSCRPPGRVVSVHHMSNCYIYPTKGLRNDMKLHAKRTSDHLTQRLP